MLIEIISSFMENTMWKIIIKQISGMPALRRALESPVVKAPVSNPIVVKTENPSPGKQSVRDRHPTVSSLLSAKPVAVQNPSSPEDEQPLNLCVKDKVSSS